MFPKFCGPSLHTNISQPTLKQKLKLGAKCVNQMPRRIQTKKSWSKN